MENSDRTKRLIECAQHLPPILSLADPPGILLWLSEHREDLTRLLEHGPRESSVEGGMEYACVALSVQLLLYVGTKG
jgi:hypothetical protein